MVFGYHLPQNMLSNTFLTSANFSLVGRNLFFITNKAENFDPEIVNNTDNSSEGREAFALPTSRSVGVSINFGF